MKNITLISIFLLAVLFTSCEQTKTRYLIGVSQCSDDEWRHKMNDEILREALFFDENIEVEIRTAKDNTGRQINDIRYFMEKGVDLLIVAPNEAAPLTAVVEEVFDSGIPVIVVDRNILSDKYTAYVHGDNYEVGKAVGNYIGSTLNGKGNVVEIAGLSGSTPAIDRHQGFRNALNNYPGIQLLATEDAEWLQSPAEEKMDSLLTRFPQIDMVFAQNDRMAVGAYLAAKAKGREKEIRIVGIDALPGKDYGVDQVLNGVLDATFIYPTGGDRVMQTAMDILQGRSFQRDQILSTAIVNPTNARVMKLQTDHIGELGDKIGVLHEKVDQYFQRVNTQKMLLYAVVLILVLFIALFVVLWQAFRSKIKLNSELSVRNREITLQKEQLEQQRDQLIELSKQLEEATHAKLVFFTNVSHDFRTPLTLVSDPVEQLLNDGALNDRQTGMLKIVRKNVNILLRLVNQILDFRKYENGKLELIPRRADLRKCVEEWSHSFTTLALKKHIRFTLSIEEKEDFIFSFDVEKMERICFNLLSNAFKFTPENGRIKISLSLVTVAERESVKLVIEDTGIGVSAEHIRNIFERFYKIDSHYSGSGIGLALVRAFVELHGGDIKVDSREGNGTVFTIVIPKSQLTDESLDLPSLPEPGGNPHVQVEELFPIEDPEIIKENEDPGKKSALVIDDNPEIRNYIKNLLDTDFIVIEAENGREGVRKAMKYVPDIIICDIMMPVMDGIECCKLLKSEMQTSHIPVILLTACSLDEQRITGFESGADSYIAKPFNSRLLEVRIHNLLENRNRLKQFFGDNTTLAKESISDVDKDFVEKFRKLIDEHLGNSAISVEELGEKMGMSRVQLYRKIKSLTNYSPNELLRIARLRRASSLLASSELTIAEITYEVGFTSPSYFTKCYKEYFGENPTEFLKRKG